MTMKPLKFPASAPWQPWALICLQENGEYLPVRLGLNNSQEVVVNESTMTLLVIMSPLYQPPKVQR